MQEFGMKLLVTSETLPRTSSLPPKVKTTSGQICMQEWLEKLMKKVSMILPRHSERLAKLRRDTRRDTEDFLMM